MKLSLEAKIWIGYIVALVALVTIGFATFQSTERLREANSLVGHTHAVIQNLSRVLTLSTDVETGARGFLLSRDTLQLIPYDSGRVKLTTELASLRQLVSDNPRQQLRLDTLQRLISRKIELVGTAVEAAKQGIPLAEITKNSTGEGRRTMEDIRSCVKTMQDEETALLADRQAQEENRSDHQIQLMLLGNFLVFFTVGLAGLSIHRDIKLRQKAERELREGHTFLDSVVENIPNMVFVKDAKELRFVRFNKAGEQLLGLPKEDLIGKSDYDFFSKERADFFTAHDREVLAKGDLLDIPEESIETKSNGTRILHTKKIPVWDNTGKPQYLLGISEDITESRKAQEELKKLNDTLQQHVFQLEVANTELEAFSYSISHDLRTPLRSIAGFSQALMEDYKDKLDETGADYLRRVQAASNRMALLIDDILQLSRVTRSEILKQNTNLSALANAIIEERKQQSPNRNVTVAIQSGLFAHVDSRLIGAALENLLGNAWKYTSKTEHAHIEFGMIMQDNTEVYFVRDNGVGFDMTYAAKLFGVFERLHTAEQFEGTGIGLATVQRIINRHGGTVWAESAVNSGATFYFTLGPIGIKGANYHEQQNHFARRGQSGRRTADATSA